MKNIRQTNINVHRDAWVEINIGNLEHNIKEIKKFVPENKKILGVVKADAYGHGAVMLAPTILASGIDMLGVASIDEGVDLRNANINCEILVLGAVPVWAVESAVNADLNISIFSKGHIDACKKAYERTGIKPKVHIKIDTGMNRIGVSTKDAAEFIKEVQNSEFINLQGIFTHLAMAEDLIETEKQINKWQEIIKQIDTKNLLLHVQNSAGTLCYDIKNTNMCRIGISMYGLAPDYPQNSSIKINLKPLISLKGRIVNIHEMEKGQGVSYAYTYKTNKTCSVATIPVGYADGVERALSNKISGKVNNNEIKQIGNITMDQMMFDITNVNCAIGDVITLLDENTSIETWAKILNTINYELTCKLKVRLPRIYTR